MPALLFKSQNPLSAVAGVLALSSALAFHAAAAPLEFSGNPRRDCIISGQIDPHNPLSMRGLSPTQKTLARLEAWKKQTALGRFIYEDNARHKIPRCAAHLNEWATFVVGAKIPPIYIDIRKFDKTGALRTNSPSFHLAAAYELEESIHGWQYYTYEKTGQNFSNLNPVHEMTRLLATEAQAKSLVADTLLQQSQNNPAVWTDIYKQYPVLRGMMNAVKQGNSTDHGLAEAFTEYFKNYKVHEFYYLPQTLMISTANNLDPEQFKEIFGSIPGKPEKNFLNGQPSVDLRTMADHAGYSVRTALRNHMKDINLNPDDYLDHPSLPETIKITTRDELDLLHVTFKGSSKQQLADYYMSDSTNPYQIDTQAWEEGKLKILRRDEYERDGVARQFNIVVVDIPYNSEQTAFCDTRSSRRISQAPLQVCPGK